MARRFPGMKSSLISRDLMGTSRLPKRRRANQVKIEHSRRACLRLPGPDLLRVLWPRSLQR